MAKRKKTSDEPVLTIPLAQIEVLPELQPREQIHTQTVQEYAERMEAGDEFPPVTVFTKGKAYWLADGFHRYFAAEKLGVETLQAEVHEGGKRAARWHALGANKAHGLRRSNADKRLAVQRALEDRPNLSDRAIADHVGVSHTFVAKCRSELENGGGVETVSTRTDSTGRQQPAHKASGKPVDPAAIPMGDEDPGEPDGTDEDGQPAPLPTDPYGETLEPAVAEAFARKDELTGLMHQLSQVKTHVLRACDETDGEPDPLYAPLMPAQFKADLANAYQALKACIPHAACPHCRQIGCDVCQGRGYVNKEAYDRYVASQKHALVC